MSYTIAITGKGGRGEDDRWRCCWLPRLIARGCKPVLAVDADPNTCLDAAGREGAYTIGGIREETPGDRRQGHWPPA